MRMKILGLEEEGADWLAFEGQDKYGRLRIEISRQRAAEQSRDLANDSTAQRALAHQACQLPHDIVNRRRIVRVK